MGGESSHLNTSMTHIGWYETSLRLTCTLPDVGLDESMIKYSGLTSNAALQSSSDEMLNSVPGYASSFVTTVGAFTAIPNAVGLGALVISFLLELVIKGSQTETKEDTYSMFRRVFGEEKASAVRDTMSEYVNRHRVHMHDTPQLIVELQRLETVLSSHLNTLKNSLKLDGQMSSRSFKIWVNGAAFHIQMEIHKARLKRPTEQEYTNAVRAINNLIDLRMLELDTLLDKYKTYKISQTKITDFEQYVGDGYPCCMVKYGCEIRNKEHTRCMIVHDGKQDPCGRADLVEAYVNHMFSKYGPISTLKSHFQNVKNNVMGLINQHGDFIAPQSQ